MEASYVQAKNQRTVKTFAWILIAISVLLLLRSIFTLQSVSAIIMIKDLTRKFNPPMDINYTPYFIEHAIELLLCIVVFVAATFVLKFENLWRNVLVYGLTVSIIFLLISPLVDYYNLAPWGIEPMTSIDKRIMNITKTSMLIWSYTWSIIFSAFFTVVIIKLSKKEVRSLFA
ncbi:MAG: hypothetical protein M1391_18405 [Bacteroidetes bacterium]|nr:hypothetical protein [Bacteroidota bacterium]